MAEPTTQPNGIRIEVVDPTPRVVQAAPPVDETAGPAITPPAPTASSARTPHTRITNPELKHIHDALLATLDTTGRRIRATGNAREIARYEQIRERLTANFLEIDTNAAQMNAADRTALIAEMREKSQDMERTFRELDNRTPPGDPFNADKFFTDIEPTLTSWSEFTGRMARRLGNTLVSGARAIGDAAMHPGRTLDGAVEGAREGAGRFMDNLDAGSITGAVLGGGGGLLISNIFGPGPIKWVLMLLLVPVGMMLGASKFGGPLNNFFSGMFGGRNREGGDTRDVPQATPPQQQPAQAAVPTISPISLPTESQPGWEQPFPIEPGGRPLTREDFQHVSGVHAAVPPSVARSTRYSPESRYSATEEVYFGGRGAMPYRDVPRGEAPVRVEIDTRTTIRTPDGSRIDQRSQATGWAYNPR